MWATDVTYTITSATAVSTTGTAPTNSSATFNNTYTSNKVQMTGGNSQTLTLSGYNGYKITKLVLSMRSNQSSGSGKLSYSTDGGTSFTYLVGASNSGVAFNNAAWNGAWSTDFTNVTKDNLNIICSGNNVVIKIEATANSLFCQSFAITYESSGISSPSISADNVDIAYTATSGSIAYTINNGVNGGAVTSATVTSSTPNDWLSVSGSNPYSSPIGLTCTTNPTNAARTAIVTLTYTYNTSQTVTKNVTVTQAANPNVFDNISSITAANTAKVVKGTVVATNTKGLVVGDGTGYVYYYKNAAVDQSVGNKIKISGTTGSYGHVLQFTNAATVAEAATSDYNNTPAVTVVDATAIAAYNADLHLSDYVQFEGALAKNGNYYNITVGTATATISYPTAAQITALDALVSKTVRVKGYFTGFSSSNFTVMLEGVEEVSTPIITATPAGRSGFFYMPGNGPSAAKKISVAGSNLTANISLSASTNYEMCLTEDGDYTNSLTLTQTAGAVAATDVYIRLKVGLESGDYAGTITLTSTGATDATVNLSGSVVTTASLPFSWTGTSTAGQAELDAVTGVDVNLASDYAASNAPYRLKFDAAGKYVIVYTNEKPEAVTFTAKIFGATTTETGTKVKVQGSADGITFTDVEEFTIKGSANATFEFTTSNDFDVSHKAVKLILSNKDQGIGVGSISILSATAAPVTIPAAGYTTYCNTTKAIDFTGVTAYKVSAIGAGYVTIEPVIQAPANTPVIIEATEGTHNLGIVASAASVGTNLLLVSDGTVKGDKLYALAKKGDPAVVGFYKVKNTVTIPAGKCYLNTNTNAPEYLAFSFGEATGVNTVQGSGFKVNGQVYNLAGQRVAQPTKGLYIVNGKKMIIK